jgi:hypothetical protein
MGFAPGSGSAPVITPKKKHSNTDPVANKKLKK